MIRKTFIAAALALALGATGASAQLVTKQNSGGPAATGQLADLMGEASAGGVETEEARKTLFNLGTQVTVEYSAMDFGAEMEALIKTFCGKDVAIGDCDFGEEFETATKLARTAQLSAYLGAQTRIMTARAQTEAMLVETVAAEAQRQLYATQLAATQAENALRLAQEEVVSKADHDKIVKKLEEITIAGSAAANEAAAQIATRDFIIKGVRQAGITREEATAAFRPVVELAIENCNDGKGAGEDCELNGYSLVGPVKSWIKDRIVQSLTENWPEG